MGLNAKHGLETAVGKTSVNRLDVREEEGL